MDNWWKSRRQHSSPCAISKSLDLICDDMCIVYFKAGGMYRVCPSIHDENSKDLWHCDFLLYNSKLKALLVCVDMRIRVLVLTRIVQHSLAAHALLAARYCCNFAHRARWPMAHVALFNRFWPALAAGCALHGCVAVRVNRSEFAVANVPMEVIFLAVYAVTAAGGVWRTARHYTVAVINILPFALHKQAGAFDKLIHWHFEMFAVVLGDKIFTFKPLCWLSSTVWNYNNTAKLFWHT